MRIFDAGGLIIRNVCCFKENFMHYKRKLILFLIYLNVEYLVHFSKYFTIIIIICSNRDECRLYVYMYMLSNGLSVDS